nr:formylglycine-generating enzyme family protein [uncultured Methanomethylovorans sp.]
MRPKEIDCVCPFLRAKTLTKGEFSELANTGHTVDKGINFQGVSKDQLTSFLKQTCASRFHNVDEYSIDGNNVFYFSSESVGEKAYYLLTVLIKEQNGLTQIVLRAVSDKTHGIDGFLNEIVSELKHFVNTLGSSREIGIIKHEQVINIIDSVVQRTIFSMKDGSASANVKDSVVQRNKIEASPSSVNNTDSVVQHISIKANDKKKNEEKPASTQVKRTNVPTKETTNSRKFMFIPVMFIVILAGYWMFSPLLGANSTGQNIIVSQNTKVVDSPLDATETNNVSIDNTASTNMQFNPPLDATETDNVSIDNNTASTNTQLNLETYTNSIGMEFVLIPSGEFEMGYGSSVHEVTIGQAYYLGKYEVTQAQWVAIMGDNPSKFEGDSNPVEEVSWDDVQEFVKKLNAKEGTDKYRLPSEAEWEYACKAGTTTKYSFGDNKSKLGEYAWYSGNSGATRNSGTTYPVGQKKPNPWGLYDMHGNVFEWCQDTCHYSYNGAPTDGSAWEDGSSSDRVLRGGSWFYDSWYCLSVGCYRGDKNSGDFDLGFRLLMEV